MGPIRTRLGVDTSTLISDMSDKHNEEIRIAAARLKKIREVSDRIATTAHDLKEAADLLRADVDALTSRVDLIEGKSSKIADELIESNHIIDEHQTIQDDRLDTLET